MTDINNPWESISDIRRDYGSLSLNEGNILDNPFDLFDLWFSQILQVQTDDPTAMVLSTIDRKNRPDSRVVLLKEIEKEEFIFFSNYNSTKGQHLLYNPHAALNFYWPQMSRQVRIQGKVKKISAKRSDSYFYARPYKSQLAAIVSQQSQVIDSRESLENELLSLELQNSTPKRPEYWGGYALKPLHFEFWQGRDNRLHDRFSYTYQKTKWIYERLAP